MSIEAAGGRVEWVDVPGARLRMAVWPRGERGVVLLLNGRAEFIEKYLEPIGALQARGFAVWTLDWRGQGLSTRHAGAGEANHVAHFDAYLGDLDVMLDRHVLPALARRPLVLMGHSMGGHLGARLLARRSEAFDRAVLLAPMIDFLRGSMPRWVARTLAGAACLVPGVARRVGPSPRLARTFEGNRLTGDRARFEADRAWVAAEPGLALGRVTWGWLRASLASIAALARPEELARIDMPVLVAMSGAEAIVDNRAIRAFALGLRRGKVLLVEGARHELLREEDAHQMPLWEAIDGFLEPVQGAR